MTEQEWLLATDPQPMLEYLWGRVSNRKLRLFAIACCRRHYHRVLSERGEKIVEVVERLVDGHASVDEFSSASGEFLALQPPILSVIDGRNLTVTTARILLKVARNDPGVSLRALSWAILGGTTYADAQVSQAALLRDLFGPQPFRPVTLDLSWLTWHGGLLGSMSQKMYDSRDFSDMPVLADALEEAGCTDPDILNHCRKPSEHVRGCWVVDLLLGKE